TPIGLATSEEQMNEVNRSLQCPSWRVRDVLLYTAVVLGVSVCLLPNAWALQATPTTLSFQAIQGGTTPPSQSISISRSYNSHQTTWTASDNATWLTVSPGIGTMTNIAQFAVAVNATGLAAGTYIPSVTIKVGHRHRLIRPTQSEDEQKSSTVAPPTTTSPSTTPTTTTPSTTPTTTSPSTTPATTTPSTTPATTTPSTTPTTTSPSTTPTT